MESADCESFCLMVFKPRFGGAFVVSDRVCLRCTEMYCVV